MFDFDISNNFKHQNPMTALAAAIILATDGHRGQIDKGGVPYILHPLSVMRRCAEAGYDGYSYLITAVLHDVVEDTKCTLVSIDNIFGPNIAGYVKSVTREKDEKYYDFVLRAMDNWVGRVVKFHDLMDNTDPSRALSNKSLHLVKRYERALQEYRVSTLWGCNMYKVLQNHNELFK